MNADQHPATAPTAEPAPGFEALLDTSLLADVISAVEDECEGLEAAWDFFRRTVQAKGWDIHAGRMAAGAIERGADPEDVVTAVGRSSRQVVERRGLAVEDYDLPGDLSPRNVDLWARDLVRAIAEAVPTPEQHQVAREFADLVGEHIAPLLPLEASA